MKKILVVLFVVSIFGAQAQKFDGLAKTPPMGWNSWNRYACDINEDLIKQTADAMVASGMKEAGYEYIVIDDCWQVSRDSLGFIQADPQRFPSGIKALADYVHSKGLKFGIYSCAGTQTCGGRPGGRGHEYQDAISYARWGVDYLKYDWCNTADQSAPASYRTMRDALYSAGRPVVFSLCEWGDNKPWNWAKDIGHLWRTTGDIYNCFDCVIDHGTWQQRGVMQILDLQKGLRQFSGPDHWNDPDMLEVGNGMPENEDRAHFTMWCMLAAPLIAGNDLAAMSPATTAILTNADVIAIDQDTLGIEAFRYQVADSVETWVKPLAGGNWAVCFLNRSISAKPVEFDWQTNKIQDTVFNKILDASQTQYVLRNLWTRKETGDTKKIFKAEIQGHDVVMLRLTPKM